MLKAGVIGHPISHSKSPLIHGFWLQQFGIDGVYQTYDIAPDHLALGVDQLIKEGLKGFNVTIPHKQKIIPLCHELSEEARAIGAVNTVVIGQDGKLWGHNTDVFGFIQNLLQTIPDFKWSGKKVCVIGAGGAARAIVYAVSKQGVKEIRLTNRTRQSADELEGLYQGQAYDWDDRQNALNGADLIINTTSLGMTGQEDLVVDLSVVSPEAVVYDIVYVPLITPLLNQALDRKLKIVTGIGMLLHQARPGFELWFGQKPTVSAELEQRVLPAGR